MSGPDTRIPMEGVTGSDPPQNLQLNIRILSRVGLWANDAPGRGWRQLYPLLTLASTAVIIVSQVIDLLAWDARMEELSENIYVTLIAIMAVLKNGTVFFQREPMARLVRDLDGMSARGVLGPEQRRIFAQYKRYTEWLTKGFLIMCVATCVNYLTAPVLHAVEARPLPHRGYVPWNKTVTPNYQLTFFWLGTSTVCNTLAIGFCDTLFVSLLISAIGQFKILHYNLKHAGVATRTQPPPGSKTVPKHNPFLLKVPLRVIDTASNNKHQEAKRMRRIHLKRMEERFYQKFAIDFRTQHRIKMKEQKLSKKNVKEFHSPEMNTHACQLMKRKDYFEADRMTESHIPQENKTLLTKRKDYFEIEHVNESRRVEMNTNVSDLEQGKTYYETDDVNESHELQMNSSGTTLTKRKDFSEMELYMFKCAEHHQQLLSFIDEIESLFSLMLIYQFMASLSLFCMVAYQTTKSGPEDPKYLALLQLLVSAITQLFMYCWCSAELTDQSLKVNEAVYMCKWENSTFTFNHALKMIFLRANKPVNITAARFMSLDLDMFRQIAKTSYSFYTLLTQIDSELETSDFGKSYNADSLIW